MINDYQTSLKYTQSWVQSGEYTLNIVQPNKVSRYLLRHHDMWDCVIPLTHKLWKDLNISIK